MSCHQMPVTLNLFLSVAKASFCPTCGIKYCQDRAQLRMAFQASSNCSHRHCVFTIDEDLRHFFLEDRSLLRLPCFMLYAASFFACFIKMNHVSGTLSLVLFVFFIPSGVLLNGILISIALVTEGGFSDDGYLAHLVKHFDYTLSP